MSLITYTRKTFIIEDSDARIRRAESLARFAVYKSGAHLPPGKQPGDFIIVPHRTEVRVTDVRTDDKRIVYVFVMPKVSHPDLPSGWTKASNLAGRFLNEVVGLSPAGWALPPQGDNFTVTDDRALIRGGAPGFKSTGRAIAPGTFVLVTRKSGNTVPRGKYVRVSEGRVQNNQPKTSRTVGWTAASNLTAGWSQVYASPAWADQKGPNACWEKGQFIGPKVLADIVGAGGELEQITLDSLSPYQRLISEAAKKHLVIALESGFRTFQKQEQLFLAFQQGTGNLAARPGRSNHQHGQAFDLNTRGFDGSPVYDWLKRNGPRLGFIRTVNKEHWHWEYRPAEAADLARQGKFALPNVRI